MGGFSNSAKMVPSKSVEISLNGRLIVFGFCKRDDIRSANRVSCFGQRVSHFTDHVYLPESIFLG